MHVVQVVRRLGRVGGMESYVWNLSRELREKGLAVSIVCEQLIEQVPGIPLSKVYNLIPPVSARPRWQAMRHFQREVNRLLSSLAGSEAGPRIVHSHERMQCHDATTIHGPLTGSLKNLSFCSRLLRRKREWAAMEEAETTHPSVKQVFCVSELSKSLLRAEYPGAIFCKEIMWPGVDSSRSLSIPRKTAKNVFFVGTEWRRKGLPFAIEVIQRVRSEFPDLEFHIFGPERYELPRNVVSLPWIKIHGFKKPDFQSCRLLIHPSRNEPFGMVVAEARAAGVPCLVSDQVGAIGLNFSCVSVCSLRDPVDYWVNEAVSLLGLQGSNPEILWTWGDLAESQMAAYEHIERNEF